MTRGNIYGRLEKLEAKTPPSLPTRSPGVREKMLDYCDRIAAWKRAGSPDTEEGRELQEFAEAVRRRAAEMRGRGKL